MTGGPGSSGPGPWQILEYLAETPVSRTWRVAIPGGTAALRQDRAGAAHLGLDRVAEVAVLQAAARAGLGPACLQSDPGRGLLLTAWLPGRAWTPADLAQPGNLQRVATLLRRLHATPLPGPAVDLPGAIDRYGQAAGPGATALVIRARASLAACVAARPAAPVFCHGDPAGNIIAAPDGELRLIDWEYAGLCHPAFDLAGLTQAAGLDRDGVATLLAAYRGRSATPAELEGHGRWAAFCADLATLWCAALARAGLGQR
jgi:thiamine kinase-like enzyme